MFWHLEQFQNDVAIVVYSVTDGSRTHASTWSTAQTPPAVPLVTQKVIPQTSRTEHPSGQKPPSGASGSGVHAIAD
eukprot:1319915-Prymnesium_polylepis.1